MGRITHFAGGLALHFRAGDLFDGFHDAVAGFGLMLRQSPHKGELTLAAVQELAQASRGADENGYRTEFIELVKKARDLTGG